MLTAPPGASIVLIKAQAVEGDVHQRLEGEFERLQRGQRSCILRLLGLSLLGLREALDAALFDLGGGAMRGFTSSEASAVHLALDALDAVIVRGTIRALAFPGHETAS